MALRCSWVRYLAVLPAAVLVARAPAPAMAEDQQPPSWRAVWKWRETWAGADASRNGWLVYSGVTVAPLGHIHEAGPRLRVSGGTGGYRYAGERFDPATGGSRRRSFSATTWYADALAGYLERWGPLTAKAFGGLSGIGHNITPFDDENAAIGDEIGLKAVVELWLNLGDDGYASLDLSWSSALDTRAARARAGWRVDPTWSLGAEAWLDLDAQSDCDLGWETGGACRRQSEQGGGETDLIDYTRAGLFARKEWNGGEISISAGVSGGLFKGAGSATPEPYVTVNWLRQF